MHPSLAERAALCDLFDELGPEAPTECEGWRTTELAAHLWVREHRLDAGPGLTGTGRFAGHTDRLQRNAAQRPFADLVSDLRPESALEFSKKMSGVDDRDARNRSTMSGTLERLAAALET